MTAVRLEPLRPCLDCGRPSRGVRCPDHAVDTGYNSGEWKALRQRALLRDGFICQAALEGCDVRATEVHFDEEAAGYPDHRLATLEDLDSVCARCHGRLSSTFQKTGRGGLRNL